MPAVIIALFYLYTAILGTSLLIIDILTFYIAIIVGQLVTYKLYNSSPLAEKLNKYSSTVLIGFIIILITFTFYPPHIPLFYDAESGGYGIFALIT